MKVTIGNYVLCDGINQSPTGLSVSEQRESQSATGLRWSQSKKFDRGNKTTIVTFEIARYFSTLGDSEKFVLTHGLLVPNNGLVTFTLFDGSSVFLDATACKAIESRHVGVSTTHHYTLEGGAMRASAKARVAPIAVNSAPNTATNVRYKNGKEQRLAPNGLWYTYEVVLHDGGPFMALTGDGES